MTSGREGDTRRSFVIVDEAEQQSGDAGRRSIVAARTDDEGARCSDDLFMRREYNIYDDGNN